MKKGLTLTLILITTLINWNLNGAELNNLYKVGSAQDLSTSFSLENKSKDIEQFHRNLIKLQHWAPQAHDMESRMQKLYNNRVKSTVKLLIKINDKLKGHSNKELSTMKLDADAKKLSEVFKCQGFKGKRDKALAASNNSTTKVEYISYVDVDKVNDNIITTNELDRFKTATNKDSKELAICFIINEKLDTLEKMGYPNIDDKKIDPAERFCEIYNRFLRRDMFFLIQKTKISEELVSYAKWDTVLIDYYASLLMKKQSKGKISKALDFKRIAYDMRNIFNNITRGKIKEQNYVDYKFYLEYMNEVFLDEKWVTEIPRVNMRPKRAGLDKEMKEYTTNILLEKILKKIKR